MMNKGYTVARISVEGKNFELLVKPEPALSYREGKSTSLSNVLVAETVFSDANKGTKASEKDIEDAFGTTDIQKIAEVVLKRGTLQLTAEQRKRMVEEKRRQIIAFISRQAVDPRTKLPHPPTRLEQALEEVRFSVDPFKNVEEQANEAVKALRSVLALRIEKISVSVHIPAQYAGRTYGTVKSYGTITSEAWQSDGSWSAVVEIPAGLYGSLLEKLGNMTRGNAEAKIRK
jgi:ribosome maturation protein SDO1